MTCPICNHTSAFCYCRPIAPSNAPASPWAEAPAAAIQRYIEQFKSAITHDIGD